MKFDMRVCVGVLEDKTAVRSKCKKNCVLIQKYKLMRVFCEFLGPYSSKRKVYDSESDPKGF